MEIMARVAPKKKIIHKAAKINENGDVSALCFKVPHAINLKVASWQMYNDRFVTCPKCRRALAAKSRP